MIKRSRGKKLQEETEKQQHVIVTKNNLFKGFTTEGVRNYDQKYSGKLDSGVSFNSSLCGRFFPGKFAVPSIIAVKLIELISVVISNILCSKTLHNSFFCHNNVQKLKSKLQNKFNLMEKNYDKK